MSEWKPIETAPKDGMVMVCGKWDNGDVWYNFGNCLEVGGPYGDWDIDLDPTHWMPLPTPPQDDRHND